MSSGMPNSECPNPECGWYCNKGNIEFYGSCSTSLNATVQKTTTGIKLNIEVSLPSELLLQQSSLNQPDSMPASAPPAKLVLTHGGRIGQEFPIIKVDARIGRRDKNIGSYPEVDLTLDDPDRYVSRRHARILYRDGKYFLEDMGSTNYTMLNKVRLEPNFPYELKYGDGIVLGKIFLIFTNM